MLRQRPPIMSNQSAMFTKKQKKRSTSTSRNKENISISHNQSSYIDYSLIQEKNQQNNKSNKVTTKQKTKKQKLTQNKQRSISRISNQNSTLQVVQQSKISNPLNKQFQGIIKKSKAKNTDDNQLHAKSYMIHETNYEIDCKNQKRPIKQQINEPILSKTSTIMSASTGNIQFSDRSKDEQKLKIFQLPQQNHFNEIELTSKINKKLPSGSFNFQPKSKRLNPTKAAIMIQKTWRGYLTRKLLEEYIESFQPLYEQQLKEIRSSRQSCREIKFTTKRQQKSSFFDESGMEQSQQISSFEEIKNVEESLKYKVDKQNINKADLPLQFSNKNQLKSINDDKFLSTQRSIKTNQQKVQNNLKHHTNQRNSHNKISQFTVKNHIEFEKPSSTPESIVNQQSLKITTRKSKTFSIYNTTSLNINPWHLSEFQSLQYHCQSLQKLFSSLNTQCISDLKKQIKKNNINLNELMERQDALKDIVENGKEFVKNVLDQMTKAFQEMKKITIKGCVNESSQVSVESTQRQTKVHQNFTSQNNKINSINGNFQQQSSSQTQQNGRKNPTYKKFNGQMQFCHIQLPTEQYSVKNQSPIQEDNDEYSSDGDQENQNKEIHNQQDTQSFKESESSSQNQDHDYSIHQQSIEILNQFLINLIDEYTELSQSKNITQLQYLCETLKRVSCDSQNKTIIDRCLIEFIVQIMSETWTLREIYEAFKSLVTKNMDQQNEEDQQQRENNYDWKLYSTLRRWLDELEKWEMNIIKEVPSKMESSSFINTAENISFNELRQSITNFSNQQHQDQQND